MAGPPASGTLVSGRLILVRHGQSHGNVERRLDTRPPGADLTDLGVEQARMFARARPRPPGLLLHSVAHRAAQTAAVIGDELALERTAVDGVHEVQAGDLENRSDEDAISQFNTVYERWHQGDLSVTMPGGESGADVLDRYLPVVADLRRSYLDDRSWAEDIVVVSHGAAIRLVAAALAGVESGFVLEHHLANTDAVALMPVTDGRWSCVHWGARTPPFYPEPVVDLPGADPMG